MGDVGGLVGGLALNGAVNAFKLVGNVVPIVSRGTFFAIKKGILYEYRSENSRDATSRIKIAKLGPIDKNYQNELQF